MNEYRFTTRGGYRTFYVKGATLIDAERNFEDAPLLQRNGFKLEDLPVRKLHKRGKQ